MTARRVHVSKSTEPGSDLGLEWEELKDWLRRDGSGLDTLYRILADPDAGRAALESLVKLRESLEQPVPPTIATVISGGEVDKVINIARAESVHITSTPNADTRTNECSVVASLLTFLEDRRLLTDGSGYQSHFPDHLRKSAQEIRRETTEALRQIERDSPLVPILRRLQAGARKFQEATEGSSDGTHGYTPQLPMGLAPYLRSLRSYREEIAVAMAELAGACGLQLDVTISAGAYDDGQHELQSIVDAVQKPPRDIT